MYCTAIRSIDDVCAEKRRLDKIGLGVDRTKPYMVGLPVRWWVGGNSCATFGA